MTLSSKHKEGEQLLMFPPQCVSTNEEQKKAFDKGYNKAREELASHFAMVERIHKRLLEEKNALLENMKPSLVEFCLQICEQLIRKQLSQPESFVHLITSLLTSLNTKQEDSLSVILSTEDLTMIESYLPKLEGAKNRMGKIYFYSSPYVQKGDVRIENQSILLNCSITRELESLRNHILRMP